MTTRNLRGMLRPLALAAALAGAGACGDITVPDYNNPSVDEFVNNPTPGAEARWFTGDKLGAMADLNLIRTSSGGLAPIGQPVSDAAYVTELLEQRRYSLLFEGHRWIDVRRFGRLETLPRDVATHVIVPRWSIPESECPARSLPSPCNL